MSIIGQILLLIRSFVMPSRVFFSSFLIKKPKHLSFFSCISLIIRPVHLLTLFLSFFLFFILCALDYRRHQHFFSSEIRQAIILENKNTKKTATIIEFFFSNQNFEKEIE